MKLGFDTGSPAVSLVSLDLQAVCDIITVSAIADMAIDFSIFLIMITSILWIKCYKR